MKGSQWVSSKRYITIGPNGQSTTFYSETPSGSIDGANKDFTVSHAIATMIGLALNGVIVHPSEYSTVGTTITFVTAPDVSLSGLPFTATYV